MLSKLLKYEFKATAKKFFPLYIVLACTTLLTIAYDKFLSNINNPVIQGLSVLFAAAYVISILAVILLTIVFLIQRFYNNFFTDEGYISFTLPAKTYEHIFSKTIVSAVWTVASTVVIGLSILILMISQGLSQIKYITEQILISFGQMPSEVKHTMFFTVIMVIITVISFILLIYFCISVSSLTQKHHVLLGIATYFIIQIVNAIIFTGILDVISKTNNIINDSININPNPFIAVIAVYEAVIGIAFFFASKYIIKNHLNLQ